MRCPGLMNFSGMRRTSTRAASGRDVRVSSVDERRPRNLPPATLARHDSVAAWADSHGHNALMTPITESASGRKRALRLAMLLLGVGTVHFVAPKPFDDIIPAELPGSPRFYTYASGVAELTAGGLLLLPRTQ